MKRITSFSVDHDYITPGLYLSRIDGDVVTYDLRTRTPNGGDYMDNSTMHSVEHMMATHLRNSAYADKILYFGPMGCQTGFYLLVRSMTDSEVLSLLKRVLAEILCYDGAVYGASRKECGNYRNLDLAAAKKECRRYLDVLNEKTEGDLRYATE